MPVRSLGAATQVTGDAPRQTERYAGTVIVVTLRRSPIVFAPPIVKQALLSAIALAQGALALLFYTQPRTAFALFGRPLLDPVISRQYGLFLFSVALMYAIVATKPDVYRRFIWIAIVQRGAECVAALLDWRAGALSFPSFALFLAIEVVIAVLLLLCIGPRTLPKIDAWQPPGADRWLSRALNAFGGLQLFWTVCSTLFVQLGARLLGWKLQDAYTTQQQGIALLVIGLTSLLTATDPRRYRRLVWVPISSQALGLANAVNELRLGTISLTIAVVQWSIEAVIIATLLSLASTEEPQSEPGIAIGAAPTA